MVTTLEILPMGTEQLSSEEEGEIIEVDDDDDDNDAPPIEFEDISSDEELNLRQRIEELEARNLELEKIASISKSAAPIGPTDDYGSSPRGPADMDYIDLVDGDSSPVHQQQAHQHHHHQPPHHRRSTRHRPTPDDTTSSRHHSARHRHSAASTAHHRQSSRLQQTHEIVQRSRSRDHHSSRHNEHGKRRVSSPERTATSSHHAVGRTVVTESRSSTASHRHRDSRSHRTSSHHHQLHLQQHTHRASHQHRHSYAPYTRSRSRSSSSVSTTSSHGSTSSSTSATSATAAAVAAQLSDDAATTTAYRPDRNVLRAALKRDIPKAAASSSLQRKLQGIQKSVTQYIASGVADIVEEQEVSASIEIMELLETLTETNHDADATVAAKKFDGNGSAVIRASDTDCDAAADGKRTPIDQQLSEAISLEEQELRLAALKSAILKKHEARKKRKVIEARPYSPTDTDIVLDSHETAKTKTTTMVTMANQDDNELDVDEPQNMEISPVVSPTPSHWLGESVVVDDDKILQPVDMELSDGSTSPEYPMDEDDDEVVEDEVKRVAALCSSPIPQWMPEMRAIEATTTSSTTATTTDIRSFEIFQQQPLQHLLAEVQQPPPPPPLDKSVLAAAKHAAATAASDVGQHDEAAEEEAALRALLLSSKPKRKPAAIAPVTNVATPVPQTEMSSQHDADNSVDNLRTLAMQSLARPRVAPAVATAAAAVVVRGPDFHDVSSQKENHTRQAGDDPITTKQQPAAKPAVAIIPEHILTDTNRQLQPESGGNTTAISAKAAAIAIKRKAIAMANGGSVTAAPTDGCLPRKRPRPRSSALITSLTVRPVKPLVIRFDQSSGSDESDEWAAESQTNTTSSLDRFFDPASPASPAYPPGSPMMDQPAAAAAAMLPGMTPAATTPPPPQVAAPPTTALFEQKLEAYLRSVRSKNQPTMVEEPPKKPTKMMVTTKAGPATPLVVRHLPLSSQLEYKQLVLRMSMLEQKKRAKQKQPPVKRIIITVSNEGSPSGADSLIRQVLLKNGTEAAAKASTLNANAPPYISTAIATTLPELPTKHAPAEETAAVNATPDDTAKPSEEPAKCPKPAAAVDTSKLRSLEAGYREKSQHLHDSLKRQHLRLAHALQVRTKQLRLERERDRVQQQLQQIERDLAVQRSSFKQLCPRIVSAHKEMRAEHNACTLLARHCAQLGRRAADSNGDGTVVYTLPDDNQALIEAEFAKIQDQTQRLKALPKKRLLSDEPEPVSVHVPTTTTSVDVPTEPVAATPTEEPAVAETSNESMPSAEAGPAVEVAAEPAEPCSVDVGVAAERTEETTVEQSSEAVGVCASSCVQKYQSPLDHITQSSAVNPDVVLCPFELQGQCDDRECVYQHLIARRD